MAIGCGISRRRGHHRARQARRTGHETNDQFGCQKICGSNQLRVLQPKNLKDPEFITELRSLRADLQVVVAFRMLPEVVWSMPRLGTLNLHGSLLPAYRGAAPIQWAIIRGESMTGLTTFLLRHEIDTGDILLQRKVPILPTDNAGDLHDRMMPVGASLVLSTVDQITSGQIQPKPQDHTQSSTAPKIHHDDARIDWHQSAKKVYDFVRGMAPFPGAWTFLDGIELKVLTTQLHFLKPHGSPGTFQQVNNSLLVQTGDGQLEILELQLSGKKRMKTKDFLNGYTIRTWSLT